MYYAQTKLSLPYVFYNLRTQNFINNDAAVPGLNRNQAYSLPFLVPPDPLLLTFETLADTFFSTIRSLRERNEKLRQARNLLLPKLISGELDVSDLDINVGDAAA